MSHANGLSPFRGKINRFIIQVSHFKGHIPGVKAPKQSTVAEPSAQYNQIKEEQPIKKTEEKTQATPLPKINIEKTALGNGVSSFSLSSIQLKKEAKQKSSSKKNIVNNAQETFTQETLSNLWKAYTLEKNNQGENNIAALLEMSQPELQADHKILLKTSSDLSKVEMSKELTPLLAYLNKQLNNYKITFEIKVEDRKSEEYVYGVKEKYEYLKKINPEIEVLKKEFDLDL
jgi:DNA polymerase-3 subunit gamma/tau